MRFDENGATFLIPQELVDHALSETGRKEPDYYNALSLEHPDYGISLSTPDKEYMEKVCKVTTGGLKESQIANKVLKIYKNS